MTCRVILVVFCCALVSGCSAVPKVAMPKLSTSGWGARGKLAEAENPAAVKLSYRTSSDRLNVASGGAGMALPSATDSTLQVEYPHPAGTPDMARVVLTVQTPVKEAGWWEKVRGAQPEVSAPLEARAIDVPAGEVQVIVGKLQEESFFERSTPLTTNAFVGVEIEGARFAKEYRSLPELDALVLRAHHQGYALGSTPSAAGLAQVTPPTTVQASVVQASAVPASYPTTGASSEASYPSTAFHRLPTVDGTTLR